MILEQNVIYQQNISQVNNTIKKGDYFATYAYENYTLFY